MPPFNFKLEAKNIGPHADLKYSNDINSVKVGLFANNGSGKSFLSRMIRLTELDEVDSSKTDKLISIGETDGNFHLSIVDKELKINLTKNQKPKIVNDTDYLFHVFNSDYVKENLETLSYSPDGDIEGYILGKVNIDLTSEREGLLEFTAQRDGLVDVVKESILNARRKLDGLQIRKNLTEYGLLQYDLMYAGKIINEENNFTELKKLRATLKSMDDDVPDITNVSFVFDASALGQIKILLETSYSRSSMAESFKDKVKSKQRFVEEGVELLQGGNICPFCEQTFSDAASHLIDEYIAYLEDREAKVSKDAVRYAQALKKLETEIRSAINKSIKERNAFNEVKKFIPSYSDEELTNALEFKDINVSFLTLEKSLEKKKGAVHSVDFPHEEHIMKITNYLELCKKNSELNGEKIKTLNNKKNNILVEKRELGRRLCKACYLEEISLHKDRISKIKKLECQIDVIREEITQKESKEKASKRDKVAEALKGFLNSFFKGKYELDDESFNIKFLDTKLCGETEPSDVLSDGEKGVVAFCYYLAETHKLVSRDDDYNKLFFVIDDPISSLDFHYVYAVAQIIRNLRNTFGIETHLRYLILTHSIEFMSILMRNRIISQKLILSDGKIEKLKKELIMPYESHLRDIHKVSQDPAKAKHTTPNSVRHVLETICRFDSPSVKLSDFFDIAVEFEGNEFIYSLMHDGSHGVMRQEHAYTPEMIQSGCSAVIEFIRHKHKGQIDHIESI